MDPGLEVLEIEGGVEGQDITYRVEELLSHVCRLW